MDTATLILGRQGAVSTSTPPSQTPPNRFPQIWGFIGAFFPLATIALALRIVSRGMFSYIGADDISIIVAYMLYVVGIIATIVSTKYGLGIHIWDVDYPSTKISMQKYGFLSQVIYPASLGFTKLSILLFFVRILPLTSPWRKCMWVIATIVICQETAFTITLLLQCHPMSYYWNKEMDPPGACINRTAFYYVDAGVNICTDLVILSLPWFIFSSLRISRRKKYALLAVCSVGCFTLISSITRLPFLIYLNRSNDPTWSVVDIVVWSIAEVGSAVTAASVPPIRPLATWAFPKFTFSSRSTSNSSSEFRPLGRVSLVFSTISGGKTGVGGVGSSADIEGRDGETRSKEKSQNNDSELLSRRLNST